MGAVQTTYTAKMPVAVLGAVANSMTYDAVSRNIEGGSIPFGRAVVQGTADDQVKLGAAGTFIGLTVRDVTLPPEQNDSYAAGDSAAIMVRGTMWVTAAAAVVAGAPVYRSATGTLSSALAGTAEVAAKSGGNTGNGVFTIDALTPVLAGAKVGVYTVRCIAAAANGGTFRVEDPDGIVLGDVAVGATFADDIKFAIADGSADFVVGDGFDVTVSGGTLIANAVWETSAALNGLARVRLG